MASLVLVAGSSAKVTADTALPGSTETIACYDAERQLVMHILADHCHGEIVAPQREAELARQRAARVEAALGPVNDPVTGKRRLVATGTGFYIGAAGELLTNQHVIQNCDFLTVTSDDGEKIAAPLLAASPVSDLALLRTGRPPPGIASFSMEPESGKTAKLAVVGYPAYGMPTRLSTISLATATTADLTAPVTQISFRGEVRHGNSGSPLLDQDADVLGVVHATVDTAKEYLNTGQVTDIGVAISYTATLRFLAQQGFRPTFVSGPPAALTQEEIHAKSRRFVVQVGCWGPPPP